MQSDEAKRNRRQEALGWFAVEFYLWDVRRQALRLCHGDGGLEHITTAGDPAELTCYCIILSCIALYNLIRVIWSCYYRYYYL